MGNTLHPRPWFLVVIALASLPSSARQPQTQGEIMHAALGVDFPAGLSADRMEGGFTFQIGNTLMLSPRSGLRARLEYHNFGLSHRLLRAVNAQEGYGEIAAFTLGGIWRLHSPARPGFSAVQPGLYAGLGVGFYQRRLYFKQTTQGSPVVSGDPWVGIDAGDIPPESIITNRPGIHASLGWEATTFFVELGYRRIFTPGAPMEYLPLVMGAHF